jgi:hypothetical protein
VSRAGSTKRNPYDAQDVIVIPVVRMYGYRHAFDVRLDGGWK